MYFDPRNAVVVLLDFGQGHVSCEILHTLTTLPSDDNQPHYCGLYNCA